MAKTNVQARSPEKYEYAYLLYMQGVSAQDICKRVGITSPTLVSWKESGGWEQKRASRTISIDDLMHKSLRIINEMLDNHKDFNADAFAKAVKQLKTLKTSNTIDDDINCFMSFQDYVMRERLNNRSITDDFIKQLVALQDSYVQSKLGSGAKLK